jgi:hypothetical protein
MNFDFKNIFGIGTTQPPAKIRTKRTMSIAPLGEANRHVESGSEIVVSFETLRQLDPGDFDMLDSGRAVVEVADPVPPRQEARPLPARWEELPSCFAHYWTLAEEFRTARSHVSEIIAARVEILGTNIELSRVKFTTGQDDIGGFILAGSTMHANPRMGDAGGLISTVKPIDTADPTLRKLDRLLTLGEDAARDFYERLVGTKEITLQKAFLACGQHRLTVADELRVLLDELANIGFDLFQARTAALGLADYQIRRLYHGSADFLRFADHGTAVGGFKRSAGLDANSQPIIYSDEPVSSQAGWSLQMSDRLSELHPLLTEGRKELAKARKVSAAA